VTNTWRPASVVTSPLNWPGRRSIRNSSPAPPGSRIFSAISVMAASRVCARAMPASISTRPAAFC